MKVLQVGSSLYDWGGIERYVSYLTVGLQGRGHAVQIAAPPESPLSRRHPDVAIAQKLGLQFSYWRLPQFLKLMREGGYDAVHVHFSPDFVVPLLAARMAKVPRVVMTRHVAVRWPPAKVQRYAGKVHRIVCVSEAVRQVLVESQVPLDKLVVAKAGCPAPAQKPSTSDERSRLTPQGEDFVVGYFGRLVSDKGVQYLAQAADRLPPSVAVHAFGEGPYRKDLEAMGSRIRFHGFVPDVAEAMAACDCIAIPSIWAEPFPFAALEAMAMGKPVIATQKGGLPEMIEPDRTGLLVPAENAAALAGAIEALAQSPDRCREMGKAAQDRHRKDYTLEAFAERIEAVYESIG